MGACYPKKKSSNVFSQTDSIWKTWEACTYYLTHIMNHKNLHVNNKHSQTNWSLSLKRGEEEECLGGSN